YPQCDLNNAREIAKGYNNIIESVEYKQKGLNLKEYLQLLDIKDKNKNKYKNKYKYITLNNMKNLLI
ncbi:MAG: hypothetical protein MR025_08235, partial [Helicobacter trogontum]|nr:hypothetical protein [Helicobacter trogontum]